MDRPVNCTTISYCILSLAGLFFVCFFCFSMSYVMFNMLMRFCFSGVGMRSLSGFDCFFLFLFRGFGLGQTD